MKKNCVTNESTRCLMRRHGRTIGTIFLSPILILVVGLAPAEFWSKTNTTSELNLKARKLLKNADRELQDSNYKKACKDYQQASEMLEQVQQFGGNASYSISEAHRGLGNCFAASGNLQGAIKEYLMSEGVPSPSSGEDSTSAVISLMGKHIERCAVCGESIPYWEALMYFYRAAGHSGEASRTEAELNLHREANAAYSKAYDKAFGLGAAGWIAAVSGGMVAAQGGSPPPIQAPSDEEIEARGRKGEEMGWYAKMEVYKTANRPEYVQQCVQEMKRR
jgi:tetratricopeptide (TPR) repeat protein